MKKMINLKLSIKSTRNSANKKSEYLISLFLFYPISSILSSLYMSELTVSHSIPIWPNYIKFVHC